MHETIYKKLREIAVSYGIIERVNRQFIIVTVGLITSFFGFAAGALINLILISLNHPLVANYRTTLTYTSAIFGDGIVLPTVNMFCVSLILKNKSLLTRNLLNGALFSGLLITSYFHITQAINEIVNWAMPQPWHWNALGIAHAGFMFAETSFISFFFLLSAKYARKHKEVPKEAIIATIGILLFLLLLKLDYASVNLSALILK